MYNIILAVHIILSIFLIIVVLMQRSEGGGLGMGGGGNAKSASRGGLDGIGKFTWILAGFFVCTSLTLTILSTAGTGKSSVIDLLSEDRNSAASTTADPSTENTVPALPSDAPAQQ